MPSQVGVRARYLAGAVLVVLIGVALGACGDGDDEVIGGGADVTIEKRLFDPDELSIRENREITLSVVNKDEERHNFSVDHLFVDVDIPPGQRVDVKIPAAKIPRDGFFSFRCKYHQAEGMFGQLKVVS